MRSISDNNPALTSAVRRTPFGKPKADSPLLLACTSALARRFRDLALLPCELALRYTCDNKWMRHMTNKLESQQVHREGFTSPSHHCVSLFSKFAIWS